MSIFHSDLTREEISKICEKRGARLFFIGIGGASMSALAQLSRSLGFSVRGSDREENESLPPLREKGVEVLIGHSEENLKEETDLVVYTLAIGDDNPEYQKARVLGIPAVSRAEFFGCLMERYKIPIGVSGSHGKSGTTALLAELFCAAQKHPTVLSGAKLQDGENIKIGKRDFLLYEGCEYRDSFLRFSPRYLLLLNMEWDHADYFPDEGALFSSFLTAADRAGCVFYNKDDENLDKLMQKCKKPKRSVGKGKAADYRIENVKTDGGFARYTLCHDGERWQVNLQVPGAFQVSNSALALALGWHLGLGKEALLAGVENYRGIERRLERRTVGGRPCFYDYAHHPTEIAATLDTVRALTDGQISVLFSPHTYSRTKAFFDGFVIALGKADEVYLTDVYPAREAPIEGVSAAALAEAIGKKARVVSPEQRENLLQNAKGTLVFMGAGNLSDFVREKSEKQG